MSAERVPSRVEVMGWSPPQLADYLKRMNLSGCDKVVMKNSITGSRFVNLSDTDLQKFPKLHAPMISKISTEISKKEKKRGLFEKRTNPKYQEPVMDPCSQTSAENVGWGEDEFESEDDYESPYSGDEDGSGGDYESPNEDQDGANDYEPPPTEPPEDLPHNRCINPTMGNSHYIDKRDILPPAVCPRPPVSSLSPPSRMPGEPFRRDPSPHCGGRQSGSLPPEPPQIFRENKPGKEPGSTPMRGPHRNTLSTPGTQSWRPQQETPEPPSRSKPPILPPVSASIGRSNSSARVPPPRFDGRRETNDDVPKHNTFPLQHKNVPPRPGIPGPPSRHGDSLPPNVPKLHSGMGDLRGSDRQSFRPPLPSSSRSQEMDPRWYVGKVTRGQAEGCLRKVNKDGAYLVRDSTRQLENQPFTLMVLYQEKVFNIQIRHQNHQFLLGTGLKSQECFPSVSDIISHYSYSPLLLIDAKNRRSSQQNQCLLSGPAGYCMTGQNWS